ncbi:DNA polymerase Y family protein [Salinimonas marina]|uniref:DNA polymerase Y family protein n=1 Tax=Salinimonas marina TaxID=2785918 RepID=A0A7S9DY07_9ALTE|nr:DNA polymerase Y family protein [Salinimonas marina]QPG05703.1 DNA polymerase Y family protein [Salinimonas marina]
MLWAYFHFYQLTLDLLADHINEVEPLPTVVYADTTNQLVQVNQSAAQAGLRPQMGMAEAAALCPNLQIIDYQAEHEAQRLSALANRLYELAADIVVCAPDGLAIRLDTLVKYYGDLDCLWATLTRELHQAGVHYHFASAWSIEAAKVLANQRLNLLLATPDQIRSGLQACSLEALELSPKQRHALERVGINTLSRLLELPVTEIGKRFDNAFISYLYALRAEVTPARVTYHPPDRFSAHLTPSYEISESVRLAPWLEALLKEFVTYARLRNKLTSCLPFTLLFRDLPPQPMVVQAAAPLSQFAQWQSLVQLKLETLTLPAPVIQLKLQVDELEEISDQTRDFFHNRQHVFAQNQLISRLQTRLGATAVSTPVGGDDHRLSHHTANPPRVESAFKAAVPSVYLFSCQPLNEHCHIEYGPVRIHAGWWDNDIQKRDYFIARTPDGRRLSVFRSPQNEWFVQGWYC